MNQQQATRTSLKEAMKLPWNYPGMIFCPGRYYYGMFSLRFLVMPDNKGRGGDITGMLWRFEDHPEGWIFTYRFRYYAGKDNNAWDNRDRKAWYAEKLVGAESGVFAKADALIHGMAALGMQCGGMPLPPEWVLIQGDVMKAKEVIDKNPPSWMHRRQATRDERGNVTMKTEMNDMPNQ